MSRKATSASLCGLSQGLIFNAVPFQNFSGYGVVVTAECDLANSKSRYVHYIAISPLKNYFCDHFCSNFIYGRIDALCKSNNLDLKFIEICITFGIEYDAGKISKELSDLWSAYKTCNGECIVKKYMNKQMIERIKEIILDKITYLYYMQDLGLCDDRGYIVDFRDIRSISIDIAKEIVDGIECGTQIENYKNSGLSSSDGIIMPIGIMTSPQREHFMQRFSHSFARIGLQDIDKSTAERLVNSF